MTTDVRLDLDLPSVVSGSSAYRPIHYLGSKLRLVGEITALLDQVVPDHSAVCDLFSGSAVVSSALIGSRPVVAVDIQEYARVLAGAFFCRARPPEEAITAASRPVTETALGQSLQEAFSPLIAAEALAIERAAAGDPEDLASLLESGSVQFAQAAGIASISPRHSERFRAVCDALHHMGLEKSPNSLVSRYYGGLYFSFEQAIALDVLLERVAGGHSDNLDFLLAGILGAASDSVRTVGKQFAQPLRPRDKSGKPKAGLWKTLSRYGSVDPLSAFAVHMKNLVARPLPGFPGHAIRADYREFLRTHDEPVGAFYIDPPYTRDHYSRFYHVLETICLRDNPRISRTNLNGGSHPSRGLYREERHQSPFSIRSQAPAAFAELFLLTRSFEAPVLLSYSPYTSGGGSHPRVMEVEAIDALAKKHYRTVERVELDAFAHSKLNRSDLHLRPAEHSEVILICEP